MPELGKATYEIDLDDKKYHRGLDRAKKHTDRATAAMDKDMRRMAKSWERNTMAVDKNTKMSDRFGETMTRLRKRISVFNQDVLFMRNLLRVLKWPAVLSLGGLAIKSLSALTAGVGALTSALASAAGGLVAMGAALAPIAKLAAVATNGLLGLLAVVGSLGLGLTGIGGALTEMSQAQSKSGKSAMKNAKEQRTAALAIVRAEEQIQQAHKGVRDAQKDLSLARREAIRDLIDLRFAAEQGALGERRAAQSLREARATLAEVNADATSTMSERESATLSAEEAELNLREARQENTRGLDDLNKAEKKGIKNAENVVEARVALTEAHHDVIVAQRELTEQQKDAQEALDKTGSAIESVAEKMGNLPAAAQKFVRFLFNLKPKLDELRAAAAGGLLPGLEGGITSAMSNFGVFKRIISETAGALGYLAEEAGKLLGSAGFGKRLEAVGLANTVVLKSLGRAGLAVADALVHISRAAIPLTKWLASSIESWAKLWSEQVKADRISGKLAGRFKQTKKAIRAVGGTLSNLGHAFKNVLEIAAPIGIELWESAKKWSQGVREATETLEGRNKIKQYFERGAEALRLVVHLSSNFIGALIDIGSAARQTGIKLFQMLDKSAEKLRNWTGSKKGQNALKEYFEDAKPAIVAMGRLGRDVVGEFLDLGRNQNIAPLIEEVRTRLVPAVAEMFETLSEHLGPHVIDFLVEFVEAWTKLAAKSGVLEKVFDALTLGLRAINALLDNETLANITGYGIALFAIWRATKLLGALFDAKSIWKAIKWFRGFNAASANGVTVVETAEGKKQTAIGRTNAMLLEQQGLYAGPVPGTKEYGEYMQKKGKFAPGATVTPIAAPKMSGARGAASSILGKGAKLPVVGGKLGTAAAIVGTVGGPSAAMGLGEAGLGGAAAAAAPYLAIAAAVAAITAAVVILYIKWKAFRDFVKPVTDAFKSGFDEVKVAAGELWHSVQELIAAFGNKEEGLVGAGHDFYKAFKGPIDTIGRVLKSTFLMPFKFGLQQIANLIKVVAGILVGNMKIMQGAIEIVTGVLTGDFGKAWEGLQNIVKGVLKQIVTLLRGLVDPFINIGRRIDEVLTAAFGGMWGTIKGVFVDGVNAVIDIVNTFLDIIEELPFVPDLGPIGHVGGQAKQKEARERQATARGGGAHARGGHITSGAPVGDSVPAMLERNEYVLNKKAVDFMGGPSTLDQINFGMAPRFARGGRVGMDVGGLAGKVAGGVKDFATDPLGSAADVAKDLVGKGVSAGTAAVLSKLPDPSSVIGDNFFGGIGDWMKGALVDWVAGKDKKNQRKGGRGVISGLIGPVPKVFAKVLKHFHAPYRSALALYEAGIQESGLRNINYGDASSTGVLQLLASTAQGLGVDPLDVSAVASLFLNRGFFGYGGAISLARKNRGMPPGEIAQLVQGSAFPDAYEPHRSKAEALLKRYGLKFSGQEMKRRGGLVRMMAGGGMVDPSWDPGGGTIASSIASIVHAWEKYSGADITAGYDPGGGHKSYGHNVSGTSTDVEPQNGNWGGAFAKGIRALTGRGFEVFYDGSLGTTAETGHGPGNHAHIEWVANSENATAPDSRDRLRGFFEHIGLMGGGTDEAGRTKAAAQKTKEVAKKGVKLPGRTTGAGGGTEAPGTFVGTAPIEFGPVPKTAKGCQGEIEQRRAQLRRYEQAYRVAKGQATKAAIKMNIDKLRRRIRLLIKTRNQLAIKEHVAKFGKKIRGVAEFDFWNNEKTGRLAMERLGWEKAEDYASQVADLEPEDEVAAKSYRDNQETSAFRSVLGTEATWRNSVLSAMLQGEGKIVQWRGQIGNMVKRIDELRGNTDGKSKRMIRELQGKIKELRRAINLTRDTTIPGWKEQLKELQGFDTNRAFISPLPEKAEAGKFGGYIWDTQMAIGNLGLKNVNGGNAKQERLEELYKQLATEARQREAVLRLQMGNFQDLFARGRGPIPAFGGVYHGGGMVPGRRGEERTIIAQAGEIVSHPTEAAHAYSSTSDVNVDVIVQDEAVDKDRIKTIYREAQAEDISRGRRRI